MREGEAVQNFEAEPTLGSFMDEAMGHCGSSAVVAIASHSDSVPNKT